MSRPLGFNDTYAIGMLEAVAAKLGISSLSDLKRHPELKFGFSNEFMDRADGWPGLRDRYGLPQRDVRGLDHDLAYRALPSGEIQATDLYSTDAEIKQYNLRVLRDDLGFFPSYECVWLYRAGSARAVAGGLCRTRATGRPHHRRSRWPAMNARAKLDRVPEDRVAAEFLASEIRDRRAKSPRMATRADCCAGCGSTSRWWRSRWRRRSRYRFPLALSRRARPRLGPLILTVVGVIQTIPSLALLVFMIPWLGIGAKPALVALFLYSLLPIVRNTATGLRDIPVSLRESAEALGLPPLRAARCGSSCRWPRARFWPAIKTAAVINVGTATIGALIGAGGFGQPILTGIRRDDIFMILTEGAIPAAVLALAVQGILRPGRAVPRPAGVCDSDQSTIKY